ncbi:MAG: ABC transporter permease [Gemmatimonadaceae bacterium]
MRIPSGIRRAFRLPLTSERIVRDLDDEVRMHVELRLETLMKQGYAREQAMIEALRRFGDVDELRDYIMSIEVAQLQRVHMTERIGSILQDLRFAARQIRKSPGFAAIAALTLALGIGATTAIFSVVSRVVLKPMSYPHAERIMQLWEVSKSGHEMAWAESNLNDLVKLNKSFSALAGYGEGDESVVSNGEGVRASLATVTTGFFDVLGVRPYAGRFFSAEEMQPGAAGNVVVISYGFWQRQFGGSPSAIGSSLTVDATRATIIGVLPRDMEFPPTTDAVVPNSGAEHATRTGHNFELIGRLKDGVTVAQAKLDVSSIMRQLKSEYGDDMDGVDGSVHSIQDEISGPIKPMLFLLLAASGILLLIACANVVNLLVARMASRENELAVRLALGAGRSRLIQQLLIEASVLALIGCAGGLFLAFAGVKALVILRPANIPGVEQVALDWRVLAFALVVSAATAIGLGGVAAWRGSRGDLRSALTNGARTMAGAGGSDRVRRTLVIVQVAMTVVLLVGAGLLGRSFQHLMSIDPGFRTRQLVVANISYGGRHDSASNALRTQFYDEAVARARSIPGVTSVGAASAMPMSSAGSSGNGTFAILNGNEKVDEKTLSELFKNHDRTGHADFRVAGADYFKTLNIPLIKGRLFNDEDRAGAPQVAVISVSLVKQRWPNEDPIGKMIEFGNMDGDLTPIMIVGVVGDVREASLAADPRPAFYVNYRQRAYGAQFRIVMATTTPGSVTTDARGMFHSMRADIPVSFSTIEELVARSLTQQRFMLFLVGVFGSVALVLATLGVYSVISYLVSQRGHELSIRVALGARGEDIVRLVLWQGVSLALIGTAVGAAGALLATRVLTKLLYEISPTDPVAFGGVIVVLVALAVVASYLPARRAGRIALAQVLRGG